MSYRDYPDVNLHYCYRCHGCSRLVTQQEIIASWDRHDGADLCPCGGARISPTNVRGFEILLPRVWKQFAAFKLGRSLNPKVEV